MPTDPNKMIGWLPPNCSCGLQAIGRASAVSYNRPFITTHEPEGRPLGLHLRRRVPGHPLARAERLRRQLYLGRRHGARRRQLLNNEVFLSVGHDEYWSGEQRANVEAARDAGVNLAFWSGNEVYWKTRWETSIDGSGTPYRTLVCYKETWSVRTRIRAHDSTGTWRDPRFQDPGPEAGELADRHDVHWSTATSPDTIKIPTRSRNLRFWSNTAVADLQPGQVATAHRPDLLGYEWDSDVDNGFRPAGLINLSSTTTSSRQYLLDYGTTVGAGTATHA